MPKQRNFVDKCIRDKDGRLAIGQLPNLPLLVWLVARLLVWPLTGTVQKVAQLIAFGALFTWAWLELFQGVNYFRRGLGVVILLGLIVSVTKQGLF